MGVERGACAAPPLRRSPPASAAAHAPPLPACRTSVSAVVVFNLVKWHRLAAGNVRDSSRTWWRQCFMHEEPFELQHPHGDYYGEKDK